MFNRKRSTEGVPLAGMAFHANTMFAGRRHADPGDIEVVRKALPALERLRGVSIDNHDHEQADKMYHAIRALRDLIEGD